MLGNDWDFILKDERTNSEADFYYEKGLKEYIDTLKTDSNTTTIQEPSEEIQETSLIDQILEEYNSNLPDECL